MALVTVPPFLYPTPPPLATTQPPAYGVLLDIDATLEKAGFVFCPPKTGSIRKVGFRTGTVVSGGANDLDVRIETVASTGLPSGTLQTTNSNIAQDIANT